MRKSRLNRPAPLVGACDWWLAKILCTEAQDLGVRVSPGDMGRDRADAELIRRGQLTVVADEVLLIELDAFTPTAA